MHRSTWNRITLLALCAAIGALLVLPTSAQAAATLVAPAEGAHLDYLELAPTVQFDPAADETPRWILLGSDAAMTTTIRYCRQFVWSTVTNPDGTSDGKFHYGCNRWATGTDSAGNDQLLALEAGAVYYWQVVSRPKGATADVVSEVRSFAIDAKAEEQSVEELGNQIMGTVFDDGTQLNLGAAAYVNSGVRVSSISSTRKGTFTFRINVAHLGTIDPATSYVRVRSAAGVRRLKVRTSATGKVYVTFQLTLKERKLKSKRFIYQAFLKSTKNAATVRSQGRVLVVKRQTVPKWTPDS